MPIPSGSVPEPRTWVDNTVMTGAVMNHEVRDPFNWLLAPPSIKVSRKTNQSIPNNANTEIIWEFEDHKSDIQHSTDADENPTRVIINTPGIYLVCCRIEIAAESGAPTGRRDLEISVNGSSTIAAETTYQPATGVPMRFSVSALYPMDTNDYFVARVFQTSGAAINIDSDENEFAVQWVSI